MNKTIQLLMLYVILLIASTFVSCKKNDCHACHYDKNGAEIEIGEYCGEDLEQIEAKGYTDSTGNYEVHCHEH